MCYDLLRIGFVREMKVIMFRRAIYTVCILLIVFIGLNYSWAHAAIVHNVSDTECAPGLEAKARDSVAAFYGEVKSSPIVSCLNQPALGLEVSYGATRFAPFLPVIVILSPEGQNEDVAAHEYAHAELSIRTSPLLRTYRIPTWFDEGLAMQLDNRAAYSQDALRELLGREDVRPSELKNISTPSQFFKTGPQGKTHYAFSKCVVKSWLEEEGPEGFDELVTNVGLFKPFPVTDFEKHTALCLD